jgi:hypothetical protein
MQISPPGSAGLGANRSTNRLIPVSPHWATGPLAPMLCAVVRSVSTAIGGAFRATRRIAPFERGSAGPILFPASSSPVPMYVFASFHGAPGNANAALTAFPQHHSSHA